MASKRRFARSLGIRESLGTKKRIDKLMQPRKVGDAQSVSEHISRQRTEPGVYPNSEQLRKHSGRASGASNTMGTGLFVCNHIEFGHWRPWHIPYIFPPRFFRNIKKQKQCRESSSPKKQKKPPKNNINFYTPPSLDSL